MSDHARALAVELVKEGVEVHVWCPEMPAVVESAMDGGVHVHRVFAGFGRTSLGAAGQLLDEFSAPRHLLVQWVPHGYGWRSMNVAFCAWLWWRARARGDRVDLIVHEPYLAFGEGSWAQNAAAAAHRVMTVILLQSTRRVFTSIPAWIDAWRPYTLGRQVEFLWRPVPNVLPVAPAGDRSELRRRYAPSGRLVGHFGAYDAAAAQALAIALPLLLGADAGLSVLFIGKGGERSRAELVDRCPGLAERAHATGVLAPADASRHLQACDVMLQPYPDGVSTRRTSAMACLAHGLPLVTTAGRFTEVLWRGSGAVALVPAGEAAALAAACAALLADPDVARSLGDAGRAFHDRRFTLAAIVNELLAADPRSLPAPAVAG